MRSITLLVVHCSATRSDRRYTFEQCRYDHIHHNRWDDIGYHYYIEKNGTIHKGRDESVKGAHVKDHNAHSIGICYEGGLAVSPPKQGEPERVYPADTRTPEQKVSLLKLLTELHARYPRALILGHRDLSPDLNHDGKITKNEWLKDCPSFDAIPEYKSLQPR